MSNKVAYFVVGPESSGTRMMVRSLTLSGVHEDLDQWDFGNSPTFSTEYSQIVVHRSVPHGQAWPDLRQIQETLRKNDFKVVSIVMIRDINATIKSQIKRGYVDSWDDGLKKVRFALQTIFAQLPTALPVTYEAFCLSDKFREWLFLDYFNLPESTIQIWYGNDNHYN